jgi:transcription termination factor Rho
MSEQTKKTLFGKLKKLPTSQSQNTKTEEKEEEEKKENNKTPSTTEKAPRTTTEDSQKTDKHYSNKKHHKPHQEIEPSGKTLRLSDLKSKAPEILIGVAEELGVENAQTMLKQTLLFHIIRQSAFNGDKIVGNGILEILNDGYGFLRSPETNYHSGPDDVYVGPGLIRRYGLRGGDEITGDIRFPKKNERYFALVKPDLLNGQEIDSGTRRKYKTNFDNLTPLFPDSKINLENPNSTDKKELSSRIIELVAPIGKGQRALIVAPPRTGKTVLMQNIAHAITDSHPEMELIVLLVDERPEEVTDMARSVKGEVISSTFDEPATRHVQIANLVIEKAKRRVEAGKDVVILLDSLTRLARAYNTVAPSSGKVLSGGVDSNALQKPKRFFGAARNIENGGSLTIIATALIDTGSRMDEVIFEEFKGTGNCEIVLDRKLSDKRIFPSIDINKSGTRKEDLLVPKQTLNKMWIIRKILYPMNTIEAMEFLTDKLKSSKNNDDFFDNMNSK